MYIIKYYTDPGIRNNAKNNSYRKNNISFVLVGNDTTLRCGYVSEGTPHVRFTDCEEKRPFACQNQGMTFKTFRINICFTVNIYVAGLCTMLQ